MPNAIVTPGVFTDAGGYIIYVGSDGKLHVKRVPPWDPDIRAVLTAATNVLDAAALAKSKRVATQLTNAALGLLEGKAGAIEKMTSV